MMNLQLQTPSLNIINNSQQHQSAHQNQHVFSSMLRNNHNQDHHQQQQQQQKLLHQSPSVIAADCSQRFESLHSKLQQEADKLKKWKLSTDFNSQQQEKELVENQQTIESQRKTILELQLENENLSTKLQDEINTGEELGNRISTNMEMTKALNDYSVVVEAKVFSLETDCDDMKSEGIQTYKQLEELSNRFDQLSMKHTESLSEIKNTREQERQSHTVEKKNYENSLTDVKSQTERLQTLLKKKDDESGDLEKRIQTKIEELQEFQTKYDNLQEDKNTLDTNVEKLTALNDSLTDQMKELQCQLDQTVSDKQLIVDQKTQLGLQIQELQATIEQLAEEKVTLIEDMKTSGEQAEKREKVVIEQVRALEDQLTKIRTISDNVKHEKTELESTLSNMKKSATELEDEKNKVDTINSDLVEEVVGLKKTVEQKTGELTVVKKELHSALDKEKSTFDKIHTLRQQLENIGSEREQLKSKVESLTAVNKRFTTENDELHQETAETKDKLLSVISEHDNSVMSLDQINVDIKNKLKELREERDQIKYDTSMEISREKSNNKSLQKDLTAKTKEVDKLKDQLSNNKKTVKELQSDTKEFNKKVISLEKENSNSKKELELQAQEGQQQSGEVGVLQEKLEHTEKQLREQITLRETSDIEKQRAETSLQSRARDSSNMFDKFFNENQEIIHEKDAELITMTATVKELRSQIDNDKKLKSKQNKQKDQSEYASKLKKLEDEVKKKDEIINELMLKTSTPQRKGRLATDSGVGKTVVSTTPLQKTPRKPIEMTPVPASTTTPIQTQAVTPKNKPETVGILRRSSSTSVKKRRVVFDEAEDDQMSITSQSSTSTLFELDVNEADGDHQVPGRRSFSLTPVPRQSPGAVLKSSGTVPLQPKKPIAMKPRNKDSPGGAIARSKENSSTIPSAYVKPQGKPPQQRKNTRQVEPEKIIWKGINRSPKDQPKKKQKNNDLSWCETDSVYSMFY